MLQDYPTTHSLHLIRAARYGSTYSVTPAERVTTMLSCKSVYSRGNGRSNKLFISGAMNTKCARDAVGGLVPLSKTTPPYDGGGHRRCIRDDSGWPGMTLSIMKGSGTAPVVADPQPR